MSIIPAPELTKLVGKASEAAAKAVDEADAASVARCKDVLKLLAAAQVTAPLLKQTDAGKRINRLSKSSNEQIAAAASQVVQAWKACVKKQAGDSGLQTSSSLPGVSSARSLSLPADNGSEQQEASTAQPALKQQQQQQQQQQRSSTPAGSAGSNKAPPRTGDSKRDKVRLPSYLLHRSGSQA
jgi:transcription elongation factor S-II